MKVQKDQLFAIEYTVQGFEGKYAVLANGESGQNGTGKMHWPVASLPEKIEIGQKILLKATTEHLEEDNQYKILRKLLEEIVN